MAWTTPLFQQALQLLEAEPVHVVLLDVDLNLRETCDLIRKIQNSGRHTHVVILTDNDSAEVLARISKLDVAGFVLKDDTFDNLVTGIKRVVLGETFFSDRIGKVLRIDRGSEHQPVSNSELTGLTDHQLQVLGHLARGESSKEIARHLHLSVRAVNSHRYRIMRRLKIRDRVQLARYAIREGLVPP